MESVKIFSAEVEFPPLCTSHDYQFILAPSFHLHLIYLFILLFFSAIETSEEAGPIEALVSDNVYIKNLIGTSNCIQKKF